MKILNKNFLIFLALFSVLSFNVRAQSDSYDSYDSWSDYDSWEETDSASSSTASPYTTSSTNAYVEPESPPPPTSSQIFAEKFKAANSLYLQRKYTEAQTKLKSISQDSRFNRSQRDQARVIFETINMEQLYSDADSKGSTTYTVTKGDSLYKIAKKHKTTIELIMKSNGLEKDVIYPDQKLKVMAKPFSVYVDKSENILKLQLEGETFKTFKVATGENNATPVGSFKVTTKLIDPIWYKTGAVVASDSPENALGTRWIGWDKIGYGIHGTIEPDSIGKQATAGCVRMLNQDVEELFNLIPRGTKVIVVD